MQLTIPNFAGYFLLAAIIVLFYFLFILFRPFFTILVFGVFFATIFYPIYKRIKDLFGGHERVASIVTCVITFLVIVLPLSLFSALLINEGVNAFNDIAQKLQSGFFEQYFEWEEGNFLYDQFQAIIPSFEFNNINLDLIGKISDAAQNLGSFLINQLSNFVKNTLTFVISLIIFFLALYYFFKDGQRIVDKIVDLSPLPKKHDRAVFKKFKEVSLAMLFGIFFTAVIQGTLAGIGYAVVGIPNPVFWATATGVFSLVPLVGTAVIWVPASIILVVTGNLVGGIGLFLWGVLLVGTIDNFVRPYLIEGKAPVHPLMTFLAVLGGIMAFGLKGLIYGPLILNLLIAFLHIYEKEYAKVLKN